MHLLARTTLKQLHADLLTEVHNRVMQPGNQPLLQSFERITMSSGGGAYQSMHEKKCTIQQMMEVLRIYNYFPTEIDVQFLATQYIVSGRQNDIQYQKFIDDVTQASRQAAGMMQASGDPKSICNAIKKQMHKLNFRINDYLVQHAGRNGTYTESELI